MLARVLRVLGSIDNSLSFNKRSQDITITLPSKRITSRSSHLKTSHLNLPVYLHPYLTKYLHPLVFVRLTHRLVTSTLVPFSEQTSDLEYSNNPPLLRG